MQVKGTEEINFVPSSPHYRNNLFGPIQLIQCKTEDRKTGPTLALIQI